MIQDTIRRMFRTPARAREARARQCSLREAQKIVQRTHDFLLDVLGGIDPADLEHVTQGRVRCASHNHDALRALLAEQPPVAAGDPLPWRLGGNLPRAVREVLGRWPQASARMRNVLPEAGLPEPGTAALIEALKCASDTAQVAPWLCRTPAARVMELASMSRGEILRVATWPNDLHILFDPLSSASAAAYGAVSAFALHLQTRLSTQEIAP